MASVILLASVGSIGFFGDFTWMYPLIIGFVFVCYTIRYGIKRPAVKFFNNYFIASYVVVSLIVGGILLYTLSIEALAMSGNLCEVIPAGMIRVRGDDARSHCFEKRVLTAGDAKGCVSITNSSGRDECYIGIAFQKRDVSLCRSITSNLRRQDCSVSVLTEQAKESNDVSICDRIIEESDFEKRNALWVQVCREKVIESNQTP